MSNQITNGLILDAIRQTSSLEYQARIPSVTQAGMKATVNALQRYPVMYNLFHANLLNVIGSRIGRTEVWNNPLAAFKITPSNYSFGVQEYLVGLVRAHGYDSMRDYGEKAVFGTEHVRVENYYHTMNRQDSYMVSVNKHQLALAFENESSGLMDYITDVMKAPTNSANWDEFMLICKQLADHVGSTDTVKIRVPAVAGSDSEADVSKALQTLISTAENMQYYSTDFNPAHMPSFAKKEDLVLFTTPEFKAALDVQTLARLFNLDQVDQSFRIVTIPKQHFLGGTAEAMLTTKDMLIIQDNLIENRSMENPANLTVKHFFHVWETISCSAFVPRVVFTRDAPEAQPVAINTVKSIDMLKAVDSDGADATTVKPGQNYNLVYTLTMNNPAGLTSGVIWSVSGNTSPATTVTPTGVLRVASDEAGTQLVVKAVSPFDAGVNRSHNLAVKKS